MDVEQSDPNSCPICFDNPEQRAVTVCGHLFCRCPALQLLLPNAFLDQGVSCSYKLKACPATRYIRVNTNGIQP